MKIKRLIAGGLTAAIATAGLAMGGMAAFSDGMGDLVEGVSTGTYTSPLIVVGADAAVSDIIGATDAAASLVSNYAVQSKDVPASGSSLSVLSGADFATTATRLYVGDTIDSARSVITAEELPSILAPGSFEDDDNNDYNYEQYIYLDNDAVVTYGASTDDVDPVLYVDIIDTEPTSSSFFYATNIVFDTAVNFSNVDVHGNDLDLLGSKYTIAATSTNAAIVLFGASAKETINAGETKTVTFDGIEYTIEVLGIQSSTLAIVKIEGETEEITEGTEETVSGLTFYVDSITKWDAQTGDGYNGYVQLSIGSQKTTLDDGEQIQIGEDDTDVDGTLVSLTADGQGDIAAITVYISAGDSDLDAIREGEAFSDTVWGSFQAEFYGMVPGADSTNREEIDVSASGKYANVKLTTKKGDLKEVDFGYGATTIELKSNKKKLHVVEGAEIAEDEYFVVDAGGFPHMFLADNIDAAGSSAGEVKLKDVFSGSTYEVVLPAGDNDVTKVIDGQTYYLNVTVAEKLRVTWKFNASDSSAGFADPGEFQTIFPAILTSKGALVAFAENLTSADGVGYGSTTHVVLPGGFLVAGESTPTKAGISYDINATVGTVGVANSVDACLIVIEEQDINDAYNSVLVTTDYDATKEAILIEPVLSGATSDESNAFITLETNDDYEKLVDIYGVVVTWNEEDDNSAVITYPNDQAVVGIGLGADPSFSVGGGVGGTYNEAVPITNPIAKFDTEITTSTLDKNLVLVGGPCANDLVKTLLDEAWNTTDSCDYWLNTHETLKDSGNGLIKIVEDAFGSGKKALIVAGTAAADTRDLIANKVIKPTVFDALDGSEFIGAV